MKNRNEIDVEALIIELVRANTDALTAVVLQLRDLMAVALAAERPRVAEVAATRKVAVSQELLNEMKGRPPGVRSG